MLFHVNEALLGHEAWRLELPGASNRRSAERPGGDGEHAVVGEAADDFRLAKKHEGVVIVKAVRG
jgi:hypothetical protein